MSTLADNARKLLECAPGEYVAERSRLVKEARHSGDRAGAKELQALSRPPLGLWAVLAAADDRKTIAPLYDATAHVARVQAAGAGRQALTEATQRRRTALERVVDVAVAAFARWDQGAEARRSEIRTIVDRLSRRPDLADAWLAGVLRDLPDDELGFAAFSDVHVTTPTRPNTERRAKVRAKQTPTPPLDADVEARKVDAVRAAELQRAQADLAVADEVMSRAKQQVQQASEALRRATAHLTEAERNLAAAAEQRAVAVARLETLD